MDYKELEEMCSEIQMYAKRTTDLWCDAKKWKWLAEHSENMDTRQKYMNVSNNLMELFLSEVSNMKLEN